LLIQATLYVAPSSLIAYTHAVLVPLRQILLALLLLVLPFQALAAVVGPLVCHSSTEQNTHASYEDHHDHSAPHDHGGDGGTQGNDHGGHLGCHHFFSAVPLTEQPAPSAADLPVFQTSLSLLATLFIPELPQRPPRS
jgi:hypothetical protein